MTAKNNARNSVTIFTRGIAHFCKVVSLEEQTKKLNIPFRKDAMDGVLATLDVFGPVRYRVPPSYTPENVDLNRLTLEPSDVLIKLASHLSGSAVSVETNSGSITGTLMGVDKGTTHVNGTAIVHTRHLVINTADGFERIAWDAIKRLRHTDEKIQEEVDAALARNLQNIKPDSTFIELELERTSDGPVSATVEYAIPLAAWKMRYSFRQTADGCQIIGAAVVDNNTDEDWNDVYVNVVTGDPITFRTDLNEVRVPHRDFIALVNEKALSNVDVEEGSGMNWAAPAGAARGRATPKMAAMRAMSADCLEACDDEDTASFGYAGSEGGAESVGVEATDVGDFQVFSTTEPLTIRANKSAIIPMFVTKVNASSSLLYKEQNHATRPYRSLTFTNDTGFSLGKGKAVVNDSGLYAGEAVLEATKPNEDRVLPYCLENGVKVRREMQPSEDWQNALNISKGVAISESVTTQETIYSVKNLREDGFNLLLEHVSTLGGGSEYTFRKDGESVTPTVEKITNGVRATVELAANASINFVVKERRVIENRVVLHSLRHLNSVLNKNADLMSDDQVRACIAAQEAIDQQQEELGEFDARSNRLVNRCELLRSNIEAVGDNQAQAEQFNSWVQELDAATNEITEIDDEKRPSADDNLRELNAALREELKKLRLTWSKK